MKPGVVRGNWQKHEDECIVSMVSRGFKWVDIAKSLHGRTGEHVRERYVNVLDNKLKLSNYEPFTGAGECGGEDHPAEGALTFSELNTLWQHLTSEQSSGSLVVSRDQFSSC